MPSSSPDTAGTRLGNKRAGIIPSTAASSSSEVPVSNCPVREPWGDAEAPLERGASRQADPHSPMPYSPVVMPLLGFGIGPPFDLRPIGALISESCLWKQAWRGHGENKHIGDLAPSEDLAALVAGCAVLLLLLMTGFYPQLIPWNLSILVSGSYVLLTLTRRRWPFPPMDALGCLLLVAEGIAAMQIATGNTSATFYTLVSLQFWAGSLLLLPLLRDGVVARLRKPAFMMGFTTVLAGIFAAALASGLADLYRPESSGATPLWWPFVYRNHLVALALVLLPLFLWNALVLRKCRLVSSAAAVLGAAGVLASGSRAGAAFLGAELLLFILLALRHTPRKQRWWAAGVLAAVVAVAIGLGGTAVLEYRLAHEGSLLEGRLDYWTASLKMIAERPFLGWGFGTWPDVYREFLVYDSGLVVNRAHSDWLEWTAEGGIAIGAMLLWLLLRSCEAAMRNPWALGLPMLLLYGTVDYTLRQPLVWAFFLILWLAVTPPSLAATRRRFAGLL